MWCVGSTSVVFEGILDDCDGGTVTVDDTSSSTTPFNRSFSIKTQNV